MESILVFLLELIVLVESNNKRIFLKFDRNTSFIIKVNPALHLLSCLGLVVSENYQNRLEHLVSTVFSLLIPSIVAENPIHPSSLKEDMRSHRYPGY